LAVRQRHGGTFILRLDDTDRQRSKAEYEAAIERDLAWLGLDWARKERQADRLEHHDAARDRLIAIGRLYPCYETPEELEFKRKRLLSQGRPSARAGRCSIHSGLRSLRARPGRRWQISCR
jgi:glutamyl-tRNA synthetase